MRDFLLLKHFRTLMYYFVTAQTAKPTPYEFDAQLYGRVLEEGKSQVSGWGGTVTIVYWPDPSRYAGICNYTPELRKKYDRTRKTIEEEAAKRSIPVIDLSQAFPDLPKDRAAENEKYFYPYPAHFKPVGYHVAAQTILRSLEKLP